MATDYIPGTFVGGQYTTTALTAEFAKIAAEFDLKLSRGAAVGNEMEEPLDMNGHPILNVTKGVNPTDVATLENLEDFGADTTLGPRVGDLETFQTNQQATNGTLSGRIDLNDADITALQAADAQEAIDRAAADAQLAADIANISTSGSYESEEINVGVSGGRFVAQSNDASKQSVLDAGAGEFITVRYAGSAGTLTSDILEVTTPGGGRLIALQRPDGTALQDGDLAFGDSSQFFMEDASTARFVGNISNTTRVAAAEADVAALEARADTTDTEQATQDARLDTIETTNTTQGGRITTAENAIVTLTTRADGTDTEQATQDGRLDVIESTNTTQGGRITTAENDIAALEGRADTTDTEQATQDSRLTALENGSSAGAGESEEVQIEVNASGNFEAIGTNANKQTLLDAPVGSFVTLRWAAANANTLNSTILDVAAGGPPAIYQLETPDGTQLDPSEIQPNETYRFYVDASSVLRMTGVPGVGQRLDVIDSTNITQGQRLSTLEGRADTTDTEQATQDGRLDVIESTNVTQGGRLTTAENEIDILEGRADTTDTEQATQDGRLDALEAAGGAGGSYESAELQVGVNLSGGLFTNDTAANRASVLDAAPGEFVTLNFSIANANTLTANTLFVSSGGNSQTYTITNPDGTNLTADDFELGESSRFYVVSSSALRRVGSTLIKPRLAALEAAGGGGSSGQLMQAFLRSTQAPSTTAVHQWLSEVSGTITEADVQLYMGITPSSSAVWEIAHNGTTFGTFQVAALNNTPNAPAAFSQAVVPGDRISINTGTMSGSRTTINVTVN